MAAVFASFGVMYALCTRLSVDASPAVLSAALCVGLMRRPEPLDVRSLLLKFVALPLVALAAGLVGLAFHTAPVLGAVVFTGGITLSILLRNYGDRAAVLGRTIALPLLTMLVVPVHISGAHGKLIPVLLVIAAGAIAFAFSTAVSWLAARLGITPSETRQRRTAPVPRPQDDGKLPVATRMALQMLAALGLAFAIGLTLFPAHWSWVVLTSFIICSGSVARGDAVYKGFLRLGGAIGGTLAGALIARVTFPNQEIYAAVVFAVLFAGIFLRQLNYAYWAACATLIFALLQGSGGANVAPLFAIRVLCILIGALCAVAATWFVYPIRTEQLVRRRVADALIGLREFLGAPEGAERSSKLTELERHAFELERVAQPVRLHRTVFGAKDADRHPAAWIDLMHKLLHHAQTPGFDRASLGAEMRRLRDMLRSREEG
jgi:hypothetical protein